MNTAGLPGGFSANVRFSSKIKERDGALSLYAIKQRLNAGCGAKIYQQMSCTKVYKVDLSNKNNGKRFYFYKFTALLNKNVKKLNITTLQLLG